MTNAAQCGHKAMRVASAGVAVSRVRLGHEAGKRPRLFAHRCQMLLHRCCCHGDWRLRDRRCSRCGPWAHCACADCGSIVVLLAAGGPCRHDYPLAFYGAMPAAGVTIGTVVIPPHRHRGPLFAALN